MRLCFEQLSLLFRRQTSGRGGSRRKLRGASSQRLEGRKLPVEDYDLLILRAEAEKQVEIESTEVTNCNSFIPPLLAVSSGNEHSRVRTFARMRPSGGAVSRMIPRPKNGFLRSTSERLSILRIPNRDHLRCHENIPVPPSGFLAPHFQKRGPLTGHFRFDFRAHNLSASRLRRCIQSRG